MSRRRYGVDDYYPYENNNGDNNGNPIAKALLITIGVIVIASFVLSKLVKKNSSVYFITSLLGATVHFGWFFFLVIGFRIWVIKKCYSMIERKGYSKDACLVAAFFGMIMPLTTLIVCSIVK